MEEIKLCDYGCGKPAIHQFKNGKWCCENNIRRCKGKMKKTIGRKKPKPIKLINNLTNLCYYGCGKIAEYQFKNGKYCCSENKNGCLTFKEYLRKKLTGRVYSKETLQRMRKSHLGKKLEEEHKRKIREKLKGRKLSLESIEKMKKTKKERGITISEKCREASIKAHTGKTPSEKCIEALRSRVGVKNHMFGKNMLLNPLKK